MSRVVPKKTAAARKLAEQILPLPCDQRYGAEEMDAVAEPISPHAAFMEEGETNE